VSPSRSVVTPGAQVARLPLVGFLARVLLLASAALHPAVGSAAAHATHAASAPTVVTACPCGVDCAR
jgi:hypothetical protein